MPPTSSSVALSKVVSASVLHTRTRSGDVDTNGHQTATCAILHDELAVACVGDVVVEQVVRRRQLPVDRGGDVGRDEIQPEDLRVGVRDRRARGTPLVDDGGGEGQPGIEVRPHTVAQHHEHLGGGIVRQVGERAVVIGRQHDDLVRLGDRVQVREHPHPPARLAGDAVAGADISGGVSTRARGRTGTPRGRGLRRDPPREGVRAVRHGRRP